jgi:hypothetical protein
MAHRIKRPSPGLASALERLLGVRLGEREPRVRGWTSVALAVVWLFQALSRGATLDERFENARRWVQGFIPRAKRRTTYCPVGDDRAGQSGELLERHPECRR